MLHFIESITNANVLYYKCKCSLKIEQTDDIQNHILNMSQQNSYANDIEKQLRILNYVFPIMSLNA